MKVTTENVATREVLLTIEPEPQQVEQAMRKAARELSRWRPVPGFRPGRAPYAMVERMLGRDLILDQAIQDMAPELYRQALKEANLEPYEQGQLDVASKDPLVLKVNVPLVPVVTLGDYKSLHIDPEPEVSITEAQIDERIETLRRQHAQYETVERPVQLGDQIVASVKGVSGEETLADQDDMTLDVTEEATPPGFAESLVGMAAGETREFSLTYAPDYEDSTLAGKKVDYTVTVKTVRKVNLPEINDDLAKTVGDYETVAQMREGIAAELKRIAEYRARQKETDAALEALVANSKVEYPAAAVKNEIENALRNQQQRLRQFGFTWENYLRMVGKTEEQLREEMRPEAERQLVRRLVLTEFARAEKLSVSESELTNALAVRASAYGDQADEFVQRMRNRDAMLAFYANTLSSKALDRLTAMLTGRPLPEEGQPAPAEGQGEPPAEQPATGAPAQPEEGQAASQA